MITSKLLLLMAVFKNDIILNYAVTLVFLNFILNDYERNYN